MSNVLGLDIGGTKIYAARYSETLELEAEVTIPTQSAKGQPYVLANILEAIKTVRNDDTISIGVAWAGFVDGERGIIKKAPNIEGFEDFPFASYFQEALSLPVYIENDARLFSLAEQKINSKKERSLLGIIIGTGVGAGLVFDGQIVRGASNFAGEVGHMILEDQDLEAEDLFSGPALTRLLSQEFQIQSLQDIDSLWENNSDRIHLIMDPILEDMAVWIYNLLLCFNPGQIVFGGGVGRHFLSRFEKQLQTKVQFRIDIHQYPIQFQIRYSKLPNAGALGAGIWSFECLKNKGGCFF